MYKYLALGLVDEVRTFVSLGHVKELSVMLKQVGFPA